MSNRRFDLIIILETSEIMIRFTIVDIEINDFVLLESVVFATNITKELALELVRSFV